MARVGPPSSSQLRSPVLGTVSALGASPSATQHALSQLTYRCAACMGVSANVTAGRRDAIARRRAGDVGGRGRQSNGRRTGATPRSARQGRHTSGLHSANSVVGAPPLLGSSPMKPAPSATRPRTTQTPLRASQRSPQRVIRRASSHTPRQSTHTKPDVAGADRLAAATLNGAHSSHSGVLQSHGSGSLGKVQVAFESGGGGGSKAPRGIGGDSGDGGRFRSAPTTPSALLRVVE